jgi:glycosyltransferase involved in cell wall biosynthesis
MSQSRVLVAQLGARRHYQQPILFHRWGLLDSFYTDFYSGNSRIINLLRYPKIYKHTPKSIKSALDRYSPNLKNAKIIHFPKFGYEYLQALKKVSPHEASQVYIWSGQEFCQRIIKNGIGKANTVYGFNGACLELFQYAKNGGIRCILDQTLADWSLVHQLLLEEDQRWPGWSLTPFSVTDADTKLLQREQKEQDLADHIICGSSFVKDSLIARGVNANKITVTPLGSHKDEKLIQHQSVAQSPKNRGDGLKILFVGSVNLRKGIPYLLQALRQIQAKIPFSCKVVGSLQINPERITEYSDVCEFMGRVPRSQMKDLYKWADVFVLPSISEGSAMVTYEALSFGVPIITTHNSGSVVRDGIDGFIIPIRDVEAISENLLKVYEIGNNCEQRANAQEYLSKISKESENKLWQVVNS